MGADPGWRSRRRITSALAVVLGAVLHLLVLAPPAARAEVGDGPCTLVLSAFPAEVNPILDRAYHREPVVTVEDRRFFPARLMGRDVVIAMTGIGLVNTEQTLRAAFATFECIAGVVFSGVAGGRWIGDVVIPDRWTEDGETFTPIDPGMRAAAQRATADGRLALANTTPLGDPLCACDLPSTISLATVEHQPEVVFGGDGQSTDPFAGQRLPCVPGGGDIFGCDPCGERRLAPPDLAGFATLLGSGFFQSYFAAPPAEDTRYSSQDMETARAARLSAEHGVPFIAFRAVSDGGGDPLGLPGFPAQFAVYRQLAADNAAVVALAFLEQWAPGR